MGRSERELPDGPLRDFAQGLRDLRAAAGRPTYRALERRAGFSASALSAAAAGERLPTLDVTRAYVGACGGDMEAWEVRWREMVGLLHPTHPGLLPAEPAESAPPAAPGYGAAPLAALDPNTAGPFTLEGRLGVGTMGVVYLGRTSGGRKVAVKVIHPALAADPRFRRRFAREVAAAGLVRGLATARIVAADAESEQPWLASEYIPGPTLAQRIEQAGPLPPDEAAALAAGIAEALAAIHAAGLVHRDLKPSNVILAPDGPKVIDFGIAQHEDASELTAPGSLLGSAAFTAPELARGEAATAAADLFALGCLLVYAIGGAPPFGQGAAAATLYRIVHESPDLGALSGVDNNLRDLVTACLDKDPAARPTPDEIITRLRPPPAPTASAADCAPPVPLPSATASPAPVPVPVPADPPSARPTPRPRRWVLRLAPLGLALAVAATAAVLGSRGVPASPPQARTPNTTATATGSAAPTAPGSTTRATASTPVRSATPAAATPAPTGGTGGGGGQVLVGAVSSPTSGGRAPATTPTGTGGGQAATSTTLTVGPNCGTMTFTTSYWYAVSGSDTGCGEGYWHKRTGDLAAADWIFTPGPGRTCSFAMSVAQSRTITSGATEYQLYDGTGHSNLLSHTYLNQADNRGGQVDWAPALATATGTYDLRLYDRYADSTVEYAGTVTATCS